MTERTMGKLGALPPVRPPGLHALAFYQSNPLPKAPDSVNAPVVGDWRMLANDHYGDCTFAGIVHARMSTSTVLGVVETWPTDQEVVDAYLKYTNGVDSGAVLSDLLHYWSNNDLFGFRITAYTPTDHADLDELKSVIATYGVAYVGVRLPVPAEQQLANNQTWTLTNRPADNNILGGHCIVLVRYNIDHVIAVTWGRTQTISWSWLQSYMTESWAIVTPEIVTCGHYGQMRLDELVEDIGKLS